MLQIHQPQLQNEYKLNVPGRGEFGITFEQNPFFNCQVNWKIGDLNPIFNRCKRELELFSKLEEHVEINVIAQTTHLLKFSLNVLYNLSSTSDPKQLPLVRDQVDYILKTHEIAEAIVSPTKRHSLRSNYVIKEILDFFIKNAEEVYDKVLYYIGQPGVGVSVNQAERMAELIKNGGLSYSIHLPYTEKNIRVRYFEPCITFLLQGLVSNAIKHSPKTKAIKVKVAIHGNEHESGIYLKVQNQTDIDQSELKNIVNRLNSPGPDLVGISETHYVSKAFWGDDVTPQWELNVENGVTWITASALIAEVVNETENSMP
jgi:signal transduction histidine kinase